MSEQKTRSDDEVTADGHGAPSDKGGAPGQADGAAGGADRGQTQPGDTQPGNTQPGNTQPGNTQPGNTGPGGDTAAGHTPSGDAGRGYTAASGDADLGDVAPDDTELAVEELELDLLGAALRQRDEYLDALRHLQADFENYKKRALKQQAESWSLAAQALVDKLLPALDTADLAVAHTEGEEIRQVRTAFVEALEREGLERIADEGGPFDPNRHDAVAHEPGEGADQEVAEVLRAGYAWKGRVLRPAMVKVRG